VKSSWLGRSAFTLIELLVVIAMIEDFPHLFSGFTSVQSESSVQPVRPVALA
jgi:hypothetical protein